MKKVWGFVAVFLILSLVGLPVLAAPAAPDCHPVAEADCVGARATVVGDWHTYTLKFYVDGSWIKTFYNVYPGEEKSVVWTDYPDIDLATTHQFTALLVGYGWSEPVTFGNCPTAIVLVRFDAWPQGCRVLLEWETASEIETLGFNVYRSTSVTGPKVMLNRSIIPSQVPPGSPVGAVYQFVDQSPPAGHLYYWLGELNIYGYEMVYGPSQTSLKQVCTPTIRPEPLPLK